MKKSLLLIVCVCVQCKPNSLVYTWWWLCEKMSTHDLSSVSNVVLFHASKMHPYLSAACFLSALLFFESFFILMASTAAFPSLSPPLPPPSLPSPAASILPPFFAMCLQMKWAACQFFIFLGSKVASQLPWDGEQRDGCREVGLAKGYICTIAK